MREEGLEPYSKTVKVRQHKNCVCCTIIYKIIYVNLFY